MPTYGFVRNNTKVPQYVGSYEIPAGSVGQIPDEIWKSLKATPHRELTVIQDGDPGWVFARTEHQPFSPRYSNVTNKPGHP